MEYRRSSSQERFISSHPVNLICIQESNLNLTFSFRILAFSALRSDRTHFRSGILFLDDSRVCGGAIIFVKQGLSFTEFFTSLPSFLEPYSDYVRVKLSLNNLFLLSFLKVCALPYGLFLDEYENRLLFSLHFFSLHFFLPSFFPFSEFFYFWETSTAISLYGTQAVLLSLVGRKYSIGSSSMTSLLSITQTHKLFSIAHLAVAPP